MRKLFAMLAFVLIVTLGWSWKALTHVGPRRSSRARVEEVVDQIHRESFRQWVEQHEAEPWHATPPVLALWPAGDPADFELLAEAGGPPVLEDTDPGTSSADLVLPADPTLIVTRGDTEVSIRPGTPDTSPARVDTSPAEEQPWWLATGHEHTNVPTDV